MNVRTRKLAMLVASFGVLAGCGAHEAGDPTPRGHMSSPGMSMSPGESMPGMSMAPGESMPGIAADDPSSAATSDGVGAGPSASARMVCGPEISANIRRILALDAAPHGTASWANHLYTCAYELPVGPLVLSVKESSDVASARTHFNSVRRQVGPTLALRGLDGLGLPAFETASGTVVFLKDNKTLVVDATHVSRVVGQPHLSRTDFAYEVATDVMGCWTGS